MNPNDIISTFYNSIDSYVCTIISTRLRLAFGHDLGQADMNRSLTR